MKLDGHISQKNFVCEPMAQMCLFSCKAGIFLQRDSAPMERWFWAEYDINGIIKNKKKNIRLNTFRAPGLWAGEGDWNQCQGPETQHLQPKASPAGLVPWSSLSSAFADKRKWDFHYLLVSWCPAWDLAKMRMRDRQIKIRNRSGFITHTHTQAFVSSVRTLCRQYITQLPTLTLT